MLGMYGGNIYCKKMAQLMGTDRHSQNGNRISLHFKTILLQKQSHKYLFREGF